jgi:hypothetical protein
MPKPRDAFIGNLKVLETKTAHAGKPLRAGRILIKLRGPSKKKPFWCEMSAEDYSMVVCYGSAEELAA